MPSTDPASLPKRLDNAPWLIAPESRRIMALLNADGAAARFVGGCVRDALLGEATAQTDRDIATTLRPEATMARLADAGIKVVPTGLAHGTITAILDHVPFEITTLRCDLATDGRHATVAFTEDFRADAARRDFTINAMFCDAAGVVHDYFDGLDDLAARRVRFVGEPVRRIREDYLRILRWFRFEARYGHDEPDHAALVACRAEVAGLERLSGERLWQELQGLLRARQPLRGLDLMRATGAMAYLLPGMIDTTRLVRLLANTDDSGDALLRLAALLRPPSAPARTVEAMQTRLRMSNAQHDRLKALLDAPLPAPDMDEAAWRRFLYTHDKERAADLLRLGATEGWPDDLRARRLAEARNFSKPTFPLTGQDLRARGHSPGPAFGRVLRQTEAWWRDTGFAPDHAACLAHAENLLAAETE